MNRIFALTATATYAHALGMMTQSSSSLKRDLPNGQPDRCGEHLTEEAYETGNFGGYAQCWSEEEDGEIVSEDVCGDALWEEVMDGEFGSWYECLEAYENGEFKVPHPCFEFLPEDLEFGDWSAFEQCLSE